MTTFARSDFAWKKSEPPSGKTLRCITWSNKKEFMCYTVRCFHFFVTETIMEEIIICTNLEAKRVENSKNRQDIDNCEMLPFLKLVMQAGLKKIERFNTGMFF
ncbi:hypothetical protein QE152_g13888 [Popillia japonica]|uniref:Uncharacterized protein n=1 Tax=Popillia japonica TaxID=7064 RepID=A0AAW1L9R3_POPJA